MQPGFDASPARRRQKMRAVLKLLLFLFDHLQVRLMYQRRRLQPMTGVLLVRVAPWPSSAIPRR